MKKITITMLLLIFTFVIGLNAAYAYDRPSFFEYNVDYEMTTRNGVDVLVSNRLPINFSSFGVELWTDIEEADEYGAITMILDQYAQLSYESETTSLKIYSSLHSETPENIFNFVESNIHYDDLLLTEDDGSEYVDLTSYQNYYMEISIVLNPSITSSEQAMILDYVNDKDINAISLFPLFDLTEYTYSLKSEPISVDDSWWHVVDGDKAYVHFAPTYYNNVDDSEINTSEMVDENHFNQLWLNGAFSFLDYRWPTAWGIYKPGDDWNKLVIEVRYRDDTEELIYNGLVDHGMTLFSNYSSVLHQWEIETTKFENGHLILDDVVFSSTYSLNFNDDKDVTDVRIYFQQSGSATVATTPSDLPTTIGSSSGYNDISEIGLAYIDVDGTDALITIDYQGQSYELLYQNFNTDFLIGIKKAIYFTDDGNRILQLIYDAETPDYIQTDEGVIATKAWAPYVHWNLTTDEIISTEKVSVLTYFKLEDAQNIYAYFYMPDVISDKLIHVDMTFDYRYYRIGIPDFWNTYPMDTQMVAISLDYGETTLTTPQWKKDLYVVTPIAMTIGAMIPGVRWPALIVGSYILAANAASIEFDLNQKEIDEIESIIPSTTLANEVEASYSRMAGETIEIDTTNNSLYKLHIGQFDAHNEVEIFENSANITNIVYEISGQRITIDEEYILDQFDASDDLGAPEGSPMNTYIMIFAIVIIAVIVIRLLPNFDKLLNSTFRVISDPKKLLALIFVVVIVVVVILLL